VERRQKVNASRTDTFAVSRSAVQARASRQREKRIDAQRGYYAQRRRIENVFVEVVAWIIVSLVILLATIL
jgi:hypothetical protein